MSDKSKLKIKNAARPTLQFLFDAFMVIISFCIAFFAFDIVTGDRWPVANWIFAIVVGAFLSYLYYLNQDWVTTGIGYVIVFAVISFVAYLALFNTVLGSHQIIAAVIAIIIGIAGTAYWGARHPIHE